MAELGFTADPTQLEESFEIVPAGEYIAIITESDYVPNKKNTGMILKLTYEVIDGEFKGRKVFENLNLQHENAQAAIIAQKSLNSICVAVGLQHVQDSAQLHGIPMILDIKVKKSAEYGEQNVIKKHLPANGGSATPSTPSASGFQQPGQAQQPPPASQGAVKKQPWQK